MYRSDRYSDKPKPIYRNVILFIMLLLLAGLMAAYFYLQASIKINAPENELGRKVIIQLENGKEVHTYENLIVTENGKMYYQGERNKIDLTGGTVEYKDWK